MLPTLTAGMHGGPVEALQRLLESFKDQIGVSPGEADGIFGDKTLRSVRALQTTARITADGIVGPTTWRLINTSTTPEMWAAMQPLLKAPIEGIAVKVTPAALVDEVELVPLVPAAIPEKSTMPWGKILGGAAAIGTGVWLWRKG